MLHGLTAAERADFSLNLFFPQKDPTSHPTWNASWRPQLVDEAYSYSDAMSTADLEKASNLLSIKNFVEKAILDYRTALGHCLTTTSAQWIAIFEDDVLFADSWFSRMLQAVQKVEKRTDKWIYLRLFNQERSTGFKVNEPAIAFGMALGAWAVLIFFRRHSRMIRRRLDSPTLILTCAVAVPAFTILFFKAGKATVMPPRPGIRAEPFGCCSQGLVFPRRVVPDLMEYLRRVEVHKTDLLIDSFSRVYHKTRWSLYPIMMQHIGIKTSQPSAAISAKEPRSVWSTAFEELDPNRLRREHARMVEQLYGFAALNDSVLCDGECEKGVTTRIKQPRSRD